MHTYPLYLPSKGKFGPSKVIIKPPTVEDVSSFLSYTGNLKTSINALVNSVCDTDISGLPTGDRDFIFLNLRQMVASTPIEGSFTCSCGSRNPQEEHVF